MLGLPASSAPSGIHFTLSRRGGAFDPGEIANMTFLTEQLAISEERFSATKREIRGNKVVRVASGDGRPAGHYDRLLGEVGRSGSWAATLNVGQQLQPIEMDLDMLTSDFVVHTTTSDRGTRFNDIFSNTHEKLADFPFPNCRVAADSLWLPGSGVDFRIAYPDFRPLKPSLETLRPSGAILGLAASDGLSQTRKSSIIKQLLDAEVIQRNLFSVMLLNAREGVLSLGGTAAEAVKAAIDDTENALRRLGDTQPHVEDYRLNATEPFTGEEGSEGLAKRQLDKQASSDWTDKWKWTPFEGADGWWQILMRGVWINGAKVLSNQPTIIDLSTPFILAPPHAARAFYASISGSRRLRKPYNSFYSFPCLNPPSLALEFAGELFPVFQGPQDHRNEPWSHKGGKLSLGRVGLGSGYCVGAVVETKIGLGDDAGGKGRKNKRGTDSTTSSVAGYVAGNGLRDVWVLGELGFRGLGMALDVSHDQWRGTLSADTA
ncbi:hypothetical protein LTS18_003229 [Coniosporium uncinatum]|uniref:Uncharacterized protein n=1 Tax=Coniosporium uncinatum TaxID=93489 RepID=A0ACC3DTS3_9PEZI|nr:hypothetical protein LTS18_003229 [Coniosporium uncinatum]